MHQHRFSKCIILGLFIAFKYYRNLFNGGGGYHLTTIFNQKFPEYGKNLLNSNFWHLLNHELKIKYSSSLKDGE